MKHHLVCLLVLSTTQIVGAADSPATAPADIPTARLNSKFDLNGIVQKMVAARQRDPIGYLAKDMDAAAELLAKFNTSEPVQPQQQQILLTLNQLIEMLENQQKVAKAGTSPSPTNPLTDSVIAGGARVNGPLRDPRVSTRMWGNLPPKEREQILQAQNEGFPAGYESILSSYYKRLAQENVNDPGDAGGSGGSSAATPATQPQAP